MLNIQEVELRSKNERTPNEKFQGKTPTAKKLISLILSILIDPCTKVTKTGSVCSNIQFFERK